MAKKNIGAISNIGSGASIKTTGYEALLKQFDALQREQIETEMLRAAEPILKRALDDEMLRHPGPLAESMRSTGVQQSHSGGYYLAYRATDTGKTGSKRTNPEKMLYLISRQYIKEGKDKRGNIHYSYEIPADNVIEKAIEKCDNRCIEAMQNVINKAIEGVFE